jgi:5-methyltetrahydrofolate--homocysteine methyltransferase
MLLIGESINGTIQKVGQAILERNETFLRGLARTQYECGAHLLDVNAGVAGGNEVEDLPWLVEIIQKQVSLPLMLDSANPRPSRLPSLSIVTQSLLFLTPSQERREME